LTDDHRVLHFTMTVDEERLLLQGGPLNYVPEVHVHRDGAASVGGWLGKTIKQG
jgi:hypothetical protein